MEGGTKDGFCAGGSTAGGRLGLAAGSDMLELGRTTAKGIPDEWRVESRKRHSSADGIPSLSNSVCALEIYFVSGKPKGPP